jgi:hypothetical protein
LLYAYSGGLKANIRKSRKSGCREHCETVVLEGKFVLKPYRKETEEKYVVLVNHADRWEVFRRLQELDIPSWCESNKPLTVEIKDTVAAVQLWSVMQQLTASRQDSIRMLERCWRLRVDKKM